MPNSKVKNSKIISNKLGQILENLDFKLLHNYNTFYSINSTILKEVYTKFTKFLIEEETLYQKNLVTLITHSKILIDNFFQDKERINDIIEINKISTKQFKNLFTEVYSLFYINFNHFLLNESEINFDCENIENNISNFNLY
jgi:hypothetical protein